jgi:DeoR family transcriptional regulator, aga operon transcriptional repressor
MFEHGGATEMSMERDVRLNQLLHIIAERHRVSVSEAASELDVSEATIRRDLDELAGQQLLRRMRGGAAANNVAYDLPLRYKAGRKAPEKQRIGIAAARRVKPGSVVGLNGGTTATEVARALAARPELGDGASGAGLTVVTNSLNIATELTVRPHTKIVVTGGVCRSQSYELTGPLATGVLEQLSLDIAFLGVDGLDPVAGATAHHEGEASTNRLMALRSGCIAVVTDSTKLGRRAFSRICRTEEIGLLITDSAADPDLVASLRDLEVEVVLV